MLRFLATLSTILLVSYLHSQEIDLEDHLVASYLFNRNANNEVKDMNHGIPENISWETDRFGKTGTCAGFNGYSGRITIPHTEDLNWDARSESYSILFWVKSPDPSNNNSGSRRLMNKWSEMLSESYPFSFHHVNSERLTANIFDRVSSRACVYNNPWDKQWHHIAMINDHESETLSIYQDGKLVDSFQGRLNQTTRNESPIRIGFTSSYTGEIIGHYLGLFDDLYFYDRAMNACEIEALYSGQLVEER